MSAGIFAKQMLEELRAALEKLHGPAPKKRLQVKDDTPPVTRFAIKSVHGWMQIKTNEEGTAFVLSTDDKSKRSVFGRKYLAGAYARFLHEHGWQPVIYRVKP